MEERKYSVCRKLFDLAWYTKIIQIFQGSLALIILHHIALNRAFQLFTALRTHHNSQSQEPYARESRRPQR